MEDQELDLDLCGRVELARQYIGNALDERRGYRPYFHWRLMEDLACAVHIAGADVPHSVGRFVDALLLSERLVAERPDADVEAALTRQLFGCISPDDSLAWGDVDEQGGIAASMHDQREALYALSSLIEFRDSDEARRAARAMCASIRRLIGDADRFPGYALQRDGWAAAPNRGHAPTTSGRLVHALVRYYRLTGDEVALDLARRFADDNRARCFTEDGRLTFPAGRHVHSIAGTVEGMLELGLLVGERDYVDLARRIYDVGLHPLRSSYGWVAEDACDPRSYGEANNTADVMRIALLLGRHGYPQYFEDAERALRNHLLASQLVDVSWIKVSTSQPDTDKLSYRDIARRARGGFGFTIPNDWIAVRGSRSPLNADLVQGAVQGFAAVWDSAVTVDASGTRVNLLISRDLNGVEVRSRLSAEGRLSVALTRPTNLFVRRPSWAGAGDLAVSVDGVPMSVAIQGSYLFIPTLPAGARVQVTFVRRRRKCEEFVNHVSYEVEWLGDDVVGLNPPGPHLPLYRAKATPVAGADGQGVPA